MRKNHETSPSARTMNNNIYLDVEWMGSAMISVWYSCLTSPAFYLSTVSDTCDVPLGLEDGSLKDEALSASSSYDEASVGPKNAR